MEVGRTEEASMSQGGRRRVEAGSWEGEKEETTVERKFRRMREPWEEWID